MRSSRLRPRPRAIFASVSIRGLGRSPVSMRDRVLESTLQRSPAAIWSSPSCSRRSRIRLPTSFTDSMYGLPRFFVNWHKFSAGGSESVDFMPIVIYLPSMQIRSTAPEQTPAPTAGAPKGIRTPVRIRLVRDSNTPLRPLNIWARIDRSGGANSCWPWLGPKTKQGYGIVTVGRTSTTAIRVVYEECVGTIQDGWVIDHIECDNPPCCNPNHLRAVSQRVNILRGTSPSARCAQQTHCKNGHPFDLLNTHINHQGRRVCLACRASLVIERSPVALDGMAKHARPSTTSAVLTPFPTRGEGSLTSPATGVEPVLLACGSTPSGGER